MDGLSYNQRGTRSQQAANFAPKFFRGDPLGPGSLRAMSAVVSSHRTLAELTAPANDLPPCDPGVRPSHPPRDPEPSAG